MSKISLMNGAANTKTAPAGTKVPSAAEYADHLARAAAASREALYGAANVISEQADAITVLRKELARKDDEIAALKRHIVSMARGE